MNGIGGTLNPSGPAGWSARLGALVRRIIGAPDYQAYLAHMRAEHPACQPLTEREFLKDRLTARYERPGAKCC